MLKGEKVTLRAREREDIKRLHELESNVDLVILGNGVWEPEPLAAMEKHFEKHLGDEEHTRFVIEADGAVIGTIALHHTDRRNGTSEFGIGIYDPAYVGKGYGRDAIEVLLRWAFRVQNYRRIWLTTGANNLRAIKAYEACGFVREGSLREHIVVDGGYADMVQMGILRREWEARQG